MSDDIQPSDAKARAVAKVAARLGVTEKSVMVLAANGLLPRFINAKTASLITGKPKQAQRTVREIVADDPDLDEEFCARFNRLVAFGAGLTNAERAAVRKVWNGRTRIDAVAVQAILKKAKLSH